MTREGLRKTTEADLLPWQREVGTAYSFLMLAQERLSLVDAGAEDEEEKMMALANRIGNLARILDRHRDNVGRVPDRIDVTPKGEALRTYYYKEDNSFKRVSLTKFRRPDFDHAVSVPLGEWARDVRITSGIRLTLMDFIPPVNKEVIIDAVTPVPEKVEIV